MRESVEIKPDLEVLNTYFRYDPDMGGLVWKINRCSAKEGTLAGADNGGYRRVAVNGRRYLVHRLVYYMATRDWPGQLVVDHIDHNPGNNRIENLRLVSIKENTHNVTSKTNNEAGFLGVTVRHNRSGSIKYRAAIRVDGKLISLGTFDTPEVAHEVYLAEKKRLHSGSLHEPKNPELGRKLKVSGTGEKYIYNNRKGFQIKFLNGSYGTYKTLEEAVARRNYLMERKFHEV